MPGRQLQPTEQQTGDAKPHIPLGERFWPLSNDEKDQIHALFETGSGTLLGSVLCLEPGQDASIKVLDAAYWVKGCSSLGRRRYAVLLDHGAACPEGGPLSG